MQLTTRTILIGLAAMPVALAGLGPANADALTVNTEGTAATAITIDALDWNQGTTLSDGIPLAERDTFNAYTQAVLGNFQLGGSNVASPGTAYQWTVVIGFQETVLALDDPLDTGIDTNGTFRTIANPDSSQLTIYYNGTAVADQLAGTGFTAGTAILQADLDSNSLGTFLIDPNSLPGATLGTEDLDQFGSDNWSGQQTALGTGSTGNLDFTVTNVDNSFFPDVFAGSIISMDILFGNVSQQTPFSQTDPSYQVYDPVTASTITAFGHVGDTNLIDGPYDVFQSDFNSSFRISRAPEPGSLALLGLGLAALGGRELRRHARAAT
jgi:hypothetical protein